MREEKFKAHGRIETEPVTVTEVTLVLSLEQYRELRRQVLGVGPMNGAWSAFLDVDRQLNGVGIR